MEPTQEQETDVRIREGFPDPDNPLDMLMLNLLRQSIEGVVAQVGEATDNLIDPGSFLAGSLFMLTMDVTGGDTEKVLEFFGSERVQVLIRSAREGTL